MNEALRNIPQVETLLQDPRILAWFSKISRLLTVSVVRSCIDRHRKQLAQGHDRTTDDLVNDIITTCRTREREKLQRVINGTGVIIHTNMGRSPFTRELLDRFTDTLQGYCNLEYHLPSGKRGKRGGFAEDLVTAMTGSQDTLIVNNNASSVFLVLTAFAQGKEAIVSRGELIQIGGGFRIPDIMAQTGACMVEVGTTNITTVNDYKAAITDQTAMLFSAHRSNFALQGFTEEPTLAELSRLKNEEIILVRDLGSGNIVSGTDVPTPFEPPVSQELSQGADLVCFSGDKLIGGPQAGIITGRKDLIARLKKHPLMRMIRVDKMVYLMLQESLMAHAEAEHDTIGTWKIYRELTGKAKKKQDRLYRKLSEQGKSITTRCTMDGTFGGGSLPTLSFPMPALSIKPVTMTAQETSEYFLNHDPAIVGIIDNDTFKVSIATLMDRDIDEVAGVINSLP